MIEVKASFDEDDDDDDENQIDSDVEELYNDAIDQIQTASIRLNSVRVDNNKIEEQKEEEENNEDFGTPQTNDDPNTQIVQ